MDYLSFDLRLGEWDPASRTGVAEVLRSPAGEGQRYPFLLEIDTNEWAERADRTQAMAVDLGRKLAESVLSQDSLTLWYESYQIARERERGLRLRLRIDSWELSRLPWELLYDVRRGEFLVFDPMVSLVRYIRLHAAPPVLRQSKSFKVLAVAAAPIDQAPLDWEREIALLEDALRELIQAKQVEVIPCEHATYRKLQSALLDNAPDIVHFIGHAEYDEGGHQGSLVLEDAHGQAAPLGASAAARLLGHYGANLIVFNACTTARGAWAGVAPALVRAEIPAVIAMQWPIEDEAAICWSRAFYEALSLGKGIDQCVVQGRLALCAVTSDPSDWAAPVLFLRSVSGELWTRDVARFQRRQREEPALSEAVPGGVVPGQEVGAEAGSYFKTRGPLLAATDSGLIIERPALRRALRVARQPSVTHYVAILSARQTGKTTILFRLMDLLKDDYACIFIDLSVLRAQDARACYRYVAVRLISEFREILGDFPLPETRYIESSVDFLEFLRELADAVPMPRIILLIDEVGALSPEVSDSFFNTLRTVFSEGRRLRDQLPKYMFIFSGAADLRTLTMGSNSPLNICEKLYLRDLELLDVQQIVSQFDRLGVSVADDAAPKMYELAAGHPYLTLRLCALMERAQVKEVNAETVEAAVEAMLVEDDNLRHVIHELDTHPAEQNELRSILIDGRKVTFSRNSPVLASLEMIGAIRPVQPCQVRNRIYERALCRYYQQGLEEVVPRPAPDAGLSEDIEAMYTRLRALRRGALDASGAYRQGKPWEIFAAALFSVVPAFSVYSDAHMDSGKLNIVLAIKEDEPGATYWSPYQPAILVENWNLQQETPQAVIAEMLNKANSYNLKLVFVMVTGAKPAAHEERGPCSGARGDICVVLLDDSEIARLLEDRGDLDAFLRDKVLEARLHPV